jgi:hypothetical protein
MEDYKLQNEQNSAAIDTSFVAQLLSDVYKVETPVYLPWFINPQKKLATYQGVETEPENEYENAPVRYGQKSFGAFWLQEGTYKTWDNLGKLVNTKFPKFLMPLATMVDFNREKIVNKTPVQGSSGTVKELYSLGDWDIDIKGIILPDKYNPYTQQSVPQQMEMIQQFHEIADSIKVEGQIFAQRNIGRIVTESLRFASVQGHPNMMQYSIKAVSDEDFILMDDY